MGIGWIASYPYLYPFRVSCPFEEWYVKMGVLAPFARLAAGDAAQGARATLLRWGLEGPNV